MSEGFFAPSELSIPNVSLNDLFGAMVRILPKTELVIDIAGNPEAAKTLARNESMPDGSERWYRYFLNEDLARVGDPSFSMGMVRHEFARLVKAGASFPATTWLDGGGSGFCIDKSGHTLTNYHLVSGEVAFHKRETGAVGTSVLCRGLRAEIGRRDRHGCWSWHPADRVWLVSNPPSDRAIQDDGPNGAQLREDTALLRVEPPPHSFNHLSHRIPSVGERIWMAGFPLRSARPVQSRKSKGYADADASLRVSTGLITSVEGADCFSSDVDGSMGNSGAPAFDQSGKVIGMFSRVAGDGPRNAFEYGHVQRVFVASAVAAKCLGGDARAGHLRL